MPRFDYLFSENVFELLQPTTILRGEAIAIFAAATAADFTLNGSLWLFLLVALAPGLGLDGVQISWVALLWATHVGADRAVG